VLVGQILVVVSIARHTIPSISDAEQVAVSVVRELRRRLQRIGDTRDTVAEVVLVGRCPSTSPFAKLQNRMRSPCADHIGRCRIPEEVRSAYHTNITTILNVPLNKDQNSEAVTNVLNLDPDARNDPGEV